MRSLPGGGPGRDAGGARGRARRAAAAVAAVRPGVPAEAPARRVEVAGDSLSVQTQPYLVADLTAAGFAPRVEGKYSQPIESAWIQDRLAGAIAEGDEIAVVETASNDALEAWNTQLVAGWPAAEAAYRARLEHTVDELVDQCVVVVDSRDAPQAAYYHLPEAAPHINAIIAAVAAERPNVVVVPWADLSRLHDEWFWQDGLHFGDPNNGGADFHPVGAEAFSTAITAGAQQCSAKLDAITPARFTPRTTPVRILDTRDGTGGHRGRLAPGQTLDLQVGGVAGVPAGVESVDLNVTAVNEAGPGWLVVFPTGSVSPPSSNLNYGPDEVVADHVVSRVSFDGRVSLRSMAATDVVVDLSGWFTPTGVDSLHPVTPARVLDTRSGLGAPRAPVTGGDAIDLKVTGVGGVPATGVDAVVLNLTATDVERLTVVRAWPGDQPQPLVSNLNPGAGSTRANLVTVRVAADGTVRLGNLLGRVDLVADVQGWYGAGPGAGLRGVSPHRMLDTRVTGPAARSRAVGHRPPRRGRPRSSRRRRGVRDGDGGDADGRRLCERVSVRSRGTAGLGRQLRRRRHRAEPGARPARAHRRHRGAQRLRVDRRRGGRRRLDRLNPADHA